MVPAALQIQMIREFRNKSLRLWSTYFEHRYQGNSTEERIVFLANCWKNCMITRKED